METDNDDDMVVIIVGDGNTDDENVNPEFTEESIKTDGADDIIQKYGEFLPVKSEPDDDYEIEFIEKFPKECADVMVKIEKMDSDDENYFPTLDMYDDDIDDPGHEDKVHKKVRKKKIRKSCKQENKKPGYRWMNTERAKSFVEELRQKNPKLKENTELLIKTLAEMMNTIRIPDPPKNFCIVDKYNKAWVCRYCNADRNSLTAAARHYQEKHGPRYLICYACGDDFRSTTNLYKHEKRCRARDAGIVLKARAYSIGKRSRGRPFMQFYAPKPPKSPSTPNTTNGTKRIHRPKSFSCSECPAEFRCLATYKSHMNLHRGIRPYQCSACPNAYTSGYALARHLKLHGDVEYICDDCGRSFKLRESLVSHMNTHKPLRRFPCSECDRRFAQKAAMLHHLNKVHRNLPARYACDICGKRYPRMSLVKVHMQDVHGMLIMTRKMFLKALPTMTEIQAETAAKIVLKSDLTDVQAENVETQKQEEIEPEEYVYTEEKEWSQPEEVRQIVEEFLEEDILEENIEECYDKNMSRKALPKLQPAAKIVLKLDLANVKAKNVKTQKQEEIETQKYVYTEEHQNEWSEPKVEVGVIVEEFLEEEIVEEETIEYDDRYIIPN